MQSEGEYKYMFVNIVYIPKPLISNISHPTSALRPPTSALILPTSALIPHPSALSLPTSAFIPQPSDLLPQPSAFTPSLTVPPNAETRSLLDEP